MRGGRGGDLDDRAVDRLFSGEGDGAAFDVCRRQRVLDRCKFRRDDDVFFRKFEGVDAVNGLQFGAVYLDGLGVVMRGGRGRDDDVRTCYAARNVRGDGAVFALLQGHLVAQLDADLRLDSHRADRGRQAAADAARYACGIPFAVVFIFFDGQPVHRDVLRGFVGKGSDDGRRVEVGEHFALRHGGEQLRLCGLVFAEVCLGAHGSDVFIHAVGLHLTCFYQRFYLRVGHREVIDLHGREGDGSCFAVIDDGFPFAVQAADAHAGVFRLLIGEVALLDEFGAGAAAQRNGNEGALADLFAVDIDVHHRVAFGVEPALEVEHAVYLIPCILCYGAEFAAPPAVMRARVDTEHGIALYVQVEARRAVVLVDVAGAEQEPPVRARKLVDAEFDGEGGFFEVLDAVFPGGVARVIEHIALREGDAVCRPFGGAYGSEVEIAGAVFEHIFLRGELVGDRGKDVYGFFHGDLRTRLDAVGVGDVGNGALHIGGVAFLDDAVPKHRALAGGLVGHRYVEEGRGGQIFQDLFIGRTCGNAHGFGQVDFG